jgi:hypothetical protein
MEEMDRLLAEWQALLAELRHYSRRWEAVCAIKSDLHENSLRIERIKQSSSASND